jgi:signal transduction histidine kinase
MNLPIRIRMTAWYVVLLALILGSLGGFVVLRLRADLTGGIDGSLRPAADQVARDYRLEGARELSDSADAVLKGERPAAQVLGPGGAVLTWHGDPVAATAMLSRAGLEPVLRGRATLVTAVLGGQRFRVVARRVVREGQPQALVAAVSLAPVERSVGRVLLLLLLAGPAALVATAAGGWWLARRALAPIDRMAATAGRIGVEQLDERVPATGVRDEVGRLARTLNTMLERIERGVGEQHRLVADASHELRTPLAAMRSELDVSLLADDLGPAARAVLESTREEVDRLSRTVADLLTLAIADEGRLELERGAPELRTVAAGVLATLEPVARRRGVTLGLDGPLAAARGDGERIAHAIRNLVENAIEFSPPGGRVEVTTSVVAGAAGRGGEDPGGGEAMLRVADAGSGIAPEFRERVFDRFFRVDASRARRTGGSGLGLAIVREIADAHGGRAWVEPRSPRGSVFCLALRAAPVAAAPVLPPAAARA